MVDLLDLPTELVIECLSHLSLSELRIFFALGNSRLCSILSASVLVQYLVAQERAGVEENPDALVHLPTSDRLGYLQTREKRWLTFSPLARHTIDVNVPRADNHISDVSADGYLVLGSPDPLTERGTKIHHVHTSPEDHPSQWHTLSAGGKPIINFSKALEEYDLIVIITYAPQTNDASMFDIDAELRSFSSGDPHPFVCHPQLHVCSIPSTLGEPEIHSSVVGETLAISLSFFDNTCVHWDQLHLYHWQLGKPIIEPLPIYKVDVTFLTPDIIVLADGHGACLTAFQIPPLRRKPTKLKPWLFNMFSFPDTSHITSVSTCCSHSEPNVRYEPSIDHFPSARFLFTPTDSLISIYFEMETAEGLRERLLVIRRAAFLEELGRRHPVGVGIRWRTWGPQCARYFDAGLFSAPYLKAVAGQRIFTIARDAWDTPVPIRLLDFNPFTVKECRARGGARDTEHASIRVVEAQQEPEETHSHSVDAHSAIPNIGIPYVEIISKETFDYDVVMINNENIIGGRYEDDEGIVISLEVLHFG